MPAPASVSFRDITKSFGPQVVLADLTFAINPGTRTGVVGRNGSGKSTLLRLLSGLDMADSGTITCNPPDARIGLLPQETEQRADETVRAFLARRAGVASVEAEFEAAAIALGTGDIGAEERYDAALNRFTDSGAADFDRRSEEVIVQVGLSVPMLDALMTTLSGGQAARASLASIILSRFDILLLDEPTNDLDFTGLALLEQFLLQQQQGMLVVSHDRAFLERVATAILELDEHSHTAAEFQGGWLAYMDEKATRRRHAEEEYGEYVSTKATLTDRAQSQRQWGVQGVSKAKKNPKDNDKAQRDFRTNRTEKQASKVRVSEKALSRLETVEKPWEGWNLQLDLPVAERAGDVVLALTGAVVERDSFSLGPVTLTVGWAERIAITGLNGAGKTTLLRALLGELPLSEGTQYKGPGVVIGEIDQSRKLFSGSKSLIDIFVEQSEMLMPDARSLLAKFDLSAKHVTRAAVELSAGERTRAGLALLMARGTNCLVLDEPTNHLDIEAIEQLETALDAYTGTVLLVTHDRRLLDVVKVTKSLAIADGIVREID